MHHPPSPTMGVVYVWPRAVWRALGTVLARGKAKTTLMPFEGLRVILQVWVLWHTMEDFYRTRYKFTNGTCDGTAARWSEFAKLGGVGVDGFFTLSGFFLFQSLARSQKRHLRNIKNMAVGKTNNTTSSILQKWKPPIYQPPGLVEFYWKRWWRLWPVLAVIICVDAFISKDRDCLHKGWWQLTLMDSFAEDTLGLDVERCLGRAWSVSVEWQVALIAPFLVWPLIAYPHIGVRLYWSTVALLVFFRMRAIHKYNVSIPDPASLVRVFTVHVFYPTQTRMLPHMLGLGVGKLYNDYHPNNAADVNNVERSHVLPTIVAATRNKSQENVGNKNRVNVETKGLVRVPHHREHEFNVQMGTSNSTAMPLIVRTFASWPRRLVMYVAWLQCMRWLASEYSRRAPHAPHVGGTAGERVYDFGVQVFFEVIFASALCVVMIMMLWWPTDLPAVALSSRWLSFLASLSYCGFLFGGVGIEFGTLDTMCGRDPLTRNFCVPVVFVVTSAIAMIVTLAWEMPIASYMASLVSSNQQ